VCGIAGWLHFTGEAQSDPAVIKSMLAMLKHRGPDAMGYYIDDEAALGNTRLSIIDLVSGHQPMSDETGRYWIVFNGEIYNYKELHQTLLDKGCRFRTQSDTEVLLYAWLTWQTEVFEHLNGPFAFAIYDRLDRLLVLARDRYGKRPLYYYRTPKELMFGSELKSLLVHPSIRFTLDPEKIARIFTLWTPLAGDTAFENIHQIPPGCYLTISEGELSIRQYYDLNFVQPQINGSEKEIAQTLRHKLFDSVRLRSRSDVEIGVYLSGGLDSAIVARLAREHSLGHMRSFSISFDDAAFDETPQQTLLSTYLETEHTCLTVSHADIAASFPKAVWHAEVPLFRTALAPMLLLSQAVQNHGIKVVMTGEGADESFLGYNIFKETLLRKSWQDQLSAQQKRDIISTLYPYLNHFNEQSYGPLLNLYSRFTEEKQTGLFSHEMRYHNSKFALRLLNTNGADSLEKMSQEIRWTQADFAKFSPLQKAQWLEFKTLLAGYLLSSQGDRMSLAHGVENRCPFLDHHVVAYAASLPEDLKLKDYTNEKYILKQAFGRELPEPILNRPKQPYRAPDAVVFRETRPAYLETILSKTELEKSGMIDAGHSTLLVNKVMHSSGNTISPRENQAFIQLLSLQLLHQFFVLKKMPVTIDSGSDFATAVDRRSGQAG
jgi:asparagine synthase (glutamine-hydrolysing)